MKLLDNYVVIDPQNNKKIVHVQTVQYDIKSLGDKLFGRMTDIKPITPLYPYDDSPINFDDLKIIFDEYTKKYNKNPIHTLDDFVKIQSKTITKSTMKSPSPQMSLVLSQKTTPTPTPIPQTPAKYSPVLSPNNMSQVYHPKITAKSYETLMSMKTKESKLVLANLKKIINDLIHGGLPDYNVHFIGKNVKIHDMTTMNMLKLYKKTEIYLLNVNAVYDKKGTLYTEIAFITTLSFPYERERAWALCYFDGLNDMTINFYAKKTDAVKDYGKIPRLSKVPSRTFDANILYLEKIVAGNLFKKLQQSTQKTTTRKLPTPLMPSSQDY
jgi:hypothetical protein